VVSLKILTSTTGSKGFTLIEIVVALLIIALVSSILSLSINAGRSTTVETYHTQMNTQIRQASKLSQLKNIEIRLKLSEHQSQAMYLDSPTQEWMSTTQIDSVDLNGVSLITDVDLIKILPNGFITKAELILRADDDTKTLNIGSE
jgi:prepilin-type N-terminal cleavage/methylation domain-containing protein